MFIWGGGHVGDKAVGDGGCAVVGQARVVYGDRVALDTGDIAIPSGRVTALMGPNGSGKSTLISAVAGLVPLAGGPLRVLGAEPGSVSLRTRVATVLQSTQANDHLPLTVGELVAMARYARRGLFGRFTSEDHAAVTAAMEQLEITDLAGRHLRELSGGQRQRVLVAQGLAREPDLLLLDEPFVGLDVGSVQQIFSAVAALRSRGGTVLIATHDAGDAELCDGVMLLAGRVIAHGTADEVLTAEHLRTAYGGRLRDPAGECVHPAGSSPAASSGVPPIGAPPGATATLQGRGKE